MGALQVAAVPVGAGAPFFGVPLTEEVGGVHVRRSAEGGGVEGRSVALSHPGE